MTGCTDTKCQEEKEQLNRTVTGLKGRVTELEKSLEALKKQHVQLNIKMEEEEEHIANNLLKRISQVS